MGKALKAFLCIVFSFAFAFLGVGYAFVSSDINIIGSASSEEQTGIFITDVVVLDGSANVNAIYEANLGSKITLDNNANSTVSLQITFYNSYNDLYNYAGVKYLDEAYSNENITFLVDNFSCGNLYAAPIIAAKDYLTCNITFSYSKFVSGMNVLESLLNFNFVHASSENVAVIEGIDTNNLASINDGKVVFSNDSTQRWTNWTENAEDRGSSSTICILKDGNEFTFDTLVLHHFIDTGGCDMPEGIKVYYYDESIRDYVLLFSDERSTLNYSGDGFTKKSNYRSITRSSGTSGIATIRFTDGTSGTVDWRYAGKMPATTYELDEAITTTGIKIEIDAKAGWFIGLTELEIYDGNDNIILEN